MKTKESTGFVLTVSGDCGGKIEAAYLRLKDGEAKRTEEVIEAALLLDFSPEDELIGIKILAPVAGWQIAELAERLDPTIQGPFRRLVRSAIPAFFQVGGKT